MTVRVIEKAAELRLTCPRCKSVIAYKPRDLRDVDETWFGFVVDTHRVLDCPVCAQVIRPVRKAGAP
ncbi:MAG: hypothetical protein U0324_44230 [Polyangiales bacterium]